MVAGFALSLVLLTKAYNGVIQNMESHKQIQETTALLKILELGNLQVEQGKVAPVVDVFKRLRKRYGKRG